jgi:hypothetical protein
MARWYQLRARATAAMPIEDLMTLPDHITHCAKREHDFTANCAHGVCAENLRAACAIEAAEPATSIVSKTIADARRRLSGRASVADPRACIFKGEGPTSAAGVKNAYRGLDWYTLDAGTTLSGRARKADQRTVGGCPARC